MEDELTIIRAIIFGLFLELVFGDDEEDEE